MFSEHRLTYCRWGNEICTDDNEERAIVVASMNEVSLGPITQLELLQN